MDDEGRLLLSISRLVDEFGAQRVLSVAVRILGQKRGRPRGSGIDDTRALINMAVLIATGKAETPTEAARQSLSLTEAHTPESAIRRLLRKYRTDIKSGN